MYRPDSRLPGSRLRRGAFLSATLLGSLFFSRPALAHASGLDGSRESVAIPTWLVLLTGGAVIGASFLLVSMVTDRQFIDSINEWGFGTGISRPGWLPTVGGVFGVFVLVALVSVGFLGPQTGSANLLVLFVWSVWWAGYAMSIYLVGNTWPLFNPWRFLADRIPVSLDGRYPESLGSWPSLVGLFALVWIEVSNPIAERPTLLASIIVYSLVTVGGAVVFGTGTWFENVDPVSRVFRVFGWIAPIQRTERGVLVGLPGRHLADDGLVTGIDDVAFVIGLLWLTTFDGFVATPAWNAIITPLVDVGLPPLVGYAGLLLGGFLAFAGAYVLASRYAKRLANTVLDEATVGIRFAQALLPIAAGYHLAHYLAYFVQFVPSVLVLSADPLSPPSQLPIVVIPGWFGTLQLVFVLVGHVVAIWVAHGIAFESFTGRLQPLRSQYSYTAAMVVYTVVSIGIVFQPSIALPYL
ncbi:MAG: hypothetical protein ACOCPT_04770 [Halanaeroarchaeum sp.]